MMEDWIGVKVAKNISKNVSGHDLLSPPWKRSHLGNLARFFVTHCGMKIGEVRIIRRTLLTWIGVLLVASKLKTRSWIGAETRINVEKLLTVAYNHSKKSHAILKGETPI